MADGMLSGLRVLELSGTRAAPFCGKLLAGCGATVVKLEPPTGDPLRAEGPFVGQPGPETSVPSLFLDTGKQSLVVDLTAEAGRGLLDDLLRQADVLLTDWEPARLAAGPLEYPTVAALNPRLVVIAISPFGQTGPYRDYAANELVAQAMGGYVWITGHAEGPPVQVGAPIAHYQAGLHAAVGTLAAVLHQQATGEGQLVDVAMTEALAFAASGAGRWANTGSVLRRTGNRQQRDRPQAPYPSTMLPAADGWVHVHHAAAGLELLALLMEEPRLAHPDFATAPYQHADGIDALCLPWLSRHTKREAAALGQELRHPFAEVLGVLEVLADPQHAARGYFAPVSHPVAGDVRMPGPLFRADATPWVTARAPLFGEHTEQVLTEWLGYGPAEIAGLRDKSAIP